MAVTVNVPSDRYSIQFVLDVAVVKLLPVRTPAVGNPTFAALTVCRSISVTLQSRSTLDRQPLT
jgi:hypothetical protein